MKTTNRLFILMGIVLMLLSSNSYAQETHTITLNVNTSTVDKHNTDETCNFGQESGVSNKDFTIEVSVGDTIIWEGVSTSSDEVLVNITAINHEGGINVFNKNKLHGDGQYPERVIGTVIQGVPGDEDKYKISFKMSNRDGTFHIDPILKIKP
ncbi:MAG: hypothetical protein QNK20_11350 [Aureibaculum sp.]|nr:hypothetical protein [Aureibaculum sp.]